MQNKRKITCESKGVAVTELHETCIRCGRKLKNQKSKELGFGIVCWQKWQEEHDIKKLFSVEEKNKDGDD